MQPSEHLIQLFDTPESRAAGVCAFVAEGVARGAAVLVVAKPAHWREISAALKGQGVDVSGAVTRGALIIVDAVALLPLLLQDDVPVRELFRTHIGALLNALPTRRHMPVRIYGELVEILAECGEFAAAHTLEEYWNELAREQTMLLLCGYSSAHFGPERSAPALKAIYCTHTKVQTLATDPLGSWLTDTVSRDVNPDA